MNLLGFLYIDNLLKMGNVGEYTFCVELRINSSHENSEVLWVWNI